jgi:endonuclease YncB( thermonuclease family)
MLKSVIVSLLAALLAVTAARAEILAVVDGDTFQWGDERVRILNIDAPEMPNVMQSVGSAYLPRLD